MFIELEHIPIITVQLLQQTFSLTICKEVSPGSYGINALETCLCHGIHINENWTRLNRKARNSTHLREKWSK